MSEVDDIRQMQYAIAERLKSEALAAVEIAIQKREQAITHWWQSDLFCAQYHKAIVAKMDNRDPPNKIRLTNSCAFYLKRMKAAAGLSTAPAPKTHENLRSSDHRAATAQAKRRAIITISSGTAYLYETDEEFSR